jgi:hypothetical protein
MSLDLWVPAAALNWLPKDGLEFLYHLYASGGMPGEWDRDATPAENRSGTSSGPVRQSQI